MKIDEVLTNTILNGKDKLIKLLNTVFGYETPKSAILNKVRQGFDEKRGEHVILLEYRVRVHNHNPVKAASK